MNKKFSFIFPGQGAQYVSMGKDFFDNFQAAKLTFEEANDILLEDFSKIIFDGPNDLLQKTINSQLAIFITSTAILRVIEENFTKLTPKIVAGLSLGEYSALFSSEKIAFSNALILIKKRALFMNETCERTKGSMAAVLGMSIDLFENVFKEISQDKNVFAANFNTDGQIVITGIDKEIEEISKLLKEKGAKRIIPINVSGAFHCPLMQEAKEKLAPIILATPMRETPIEIVMNATGKKASSIEEIKKLLIEQVTSPVRWQQSIKSIIVDKIDYFLEIGPSKTLTSMNKKNAPGIPTLSIEKVQDLSKIEKII